MAFGIKRAELNAWKAAVIRGETAFLTHYWFDPRFPQFRTVTKVGNANLERLTEWCAANGLNPNYIHNRPPFPHFDLMGAKQQEILRKENLIRHLERFNMDGNGLDFS
ncbi:hypothetical protein [Cohnella cholangitidis]|uniref:Uncharacterized protein n=1 Tax=Cohnella cholangitidis TaxID=2598458 RepID=A0A7G5C4J0_9BACL|nr:hypothetical protein [Cohnella cholangitidis]QMV44124.1 hypothetical protein FPL14_25365 [Cohnella cholangitidis]